MSKKEDENQELVVKIKAKGRRSLPARKVESTGTSSVALSQEQMSAIRDRLNAGREVRLTYCGEDVLRLFLCLETDFKTLYVSSQAMRPFPFCQTPREGRLLRFVTEHGGREIGGEELAERVARVKSAQREHVTPDVVVTCPNCGAELRVGRKLQ